jgi:hypothetical protein
MNNLPEAIQNTIYKFMHQLELSGTVDTESKGSYVFWIEDNGNVIMWLENEDGDILRFLDDTEEIQFHLTPYFKRTREEMNDDNDDWEDDNFKVIQGVRHIKTRCGLVMDDEQDNDTEQITKKMKLCEMNEKKRKTMD